MAPTITAADWLPDLTFTLAPRALLHAALVAGTILLVGVGLRHLAKRRYQNLAKTPEVELREVLAHVIARTSLLFLCVLAVSGAMPLLSGDADVRAFMRRVLTVAVFWQMGLWLATAAEEWLHIRRQRSITADKAALGTLAILSVVIPAVIWSVMVLLTLDNLGVNVTTLITGLGIGGVAIALAVQNVLGDLLASLSIAFDKPFVMGDFIVVDAFMGSVEYIGMKSTRLRSLSGEQIVISNANLLSSRLRNYGRMSDRRIQFTLSMHPDTPRATLRRLPGIIADILRAQSQIRLDRCHIATLSGSAVDIESVYIVQTADYNVYMDAQQQILLRIHEALEANGARLAGPTQHILLDAPVPVESVAKTSGAR